VVEGVLSISPWLGRRDQDGQESDHHAGDPTRDEDVPEPRRVRRLAADDAAAGRLEERIRWAVLA
jgi:hypothetical protein